MTTQIAPMPVPLRRFFRVGFTLQSIAVVLIATGAYLGVIPTHIAAVPHYDTVMHLVLIGLVAFFFDGVLDHRPFTRALPFLRVGPVLVLTAAGIEEFMQRFSPRRTSDWKDFAADAAGVVLFSFLSKQLADRAAHRAAEERD